MCQVCKYIIYYILLFFSLFFFANIETTWRVAMKIDFQDILMFENVESFYHN